MRVYLAGPMSKGNLAANVNQATAAFHTLLKAGHEPFCPQWSVYAKPCVAVDDKVAVCLGTADGGGGVSHAEWLRMDLSWVGVSQAVVRLPGASIGADMEVSHARSLGIPVFAGVEEFLSYGHSNHE